MRLIVVFAVTASITGAQLTPANLIADTSFSYQGELKQNGNPVSNSLEMQFSLWDAVDNGSQIGNTQSLSGVIVSNGRFSVELDFGADAFDNARRWLEVTVDGSTLTPRTKISRSPYSLQTRGIFVDENENVGIGTTNPQRQLDLASDSASSIRLTTNDNNPGVLSKLQFKTVNAPGIFTPLGRVEFVDQDDTLLAFIQGTKAGSSNSQIDVSATPGQPAQLSVSGTGVNVKTLNVTQVLNVDEDVNANGELSILGDALAASDLTIGDDLFVDDRVGIGTVFPNAKLHISGTPGADGIRFPDNTLQTSAATEIISMSTTIDPPAVQPGASISMIVNIPGVDFDDVTVANPSTLAPNVAIAYIRYWNQNEVLVSFVNVGNSVQDPPQSTWNFRVIK